MQLPLWEVLGEDIVAVMFACCVELLLRADILVSFLNPVLFS